MTSQEICWYCKKRESAIEYFVPVGLLPANVANEMAQKVSETNNDISAQIDIRRGYVNQCHIVRVPRCLNCTHIHGSSIIVGIVAGIPVAIYMAFFVYQSIRIGEVPSIQQILVAVTVTAGFTGVFAWLISDFVIGIIGRLFGIRRVADLKWLESYQQINIMINQGYALESDYYVFTSEDPESDVFN